MSKRFTFENDAYLFTYYEPFLARHIGRDLGRSEAAIKARVAKLKKTGAWDALVRMKTARGDYFAALGIAVSDEGADQAA